MAAPILLPTGLQIVAGRLFATERLLLEMADRLPESLGSEAAQLPVRSKAEGEAHGALLALGYKPGEVVRMLKDLDSVRLSTEEMIREALKRVHRERVAER